MDGLLSGLGYHHGEARLSQCPYGSREAPVFSVSDHCGFHSMFSFLALPQPKPRSYWSKVSFSR